MFYGATLAMLVSAKPPCGYTRAAGAPQKSKDRTAPTVP